MNEGNGVINNLFSAETNYGAASFVVLIASGLSGWFGFQLAATQTALIVSNALTQGTPPAGSSAYGFVGVILIVVAFLTLVWAIALAGAGFAVKRGRIFSSLTTLVVISPVFFLLYEFVMILQATGPAIIME